MPMRINKNIHRTKRNVIIIIAVSLLLLGVAGTWYFLNNSGSHELRENAIDYNPPTDEQKNAGLNAKSEFNKAHYDTQTTESEDSGVKKEVGLLISSMNQNDNTLTIAASMEVLDDNGVCNLKLSRTGFDTIAAQVKTFKITTYSACQDFNVDITGLEKGEWSAQVDYVGNSAKGTASAKVVVK
jgi:hypothetical protein